MPASQSDRPVDHRITALLGSQVCPLISDYESTLREMKRDAAEVARLGEDALTTLVKIAQVDPDAATPETAARTRETIEDGLLQSCALQLQVEAQLEHVRRAEQELARNLSANDDAADETLPPCFDETALPVDEARRRSSVFRGFQRRANELLGVADETALDDDEELAITRTTETFVCALSGAQFVRPVTSRTCGHSFSRAAIEELLRRGGSTQCPVAGCQHHVRRSDLYDDTSLERRMRWAAAASRQAALAADASSIAV